MLILSLVTVVGLAELLIPVIEVGAKAAGAPNTIVSIAIALLVLPSEGFAQSGQPKQIAFKVV